MRALRLAFAVTLALAAASPAGAERPPNTDQVSTSLMTLMPVLTPISDYGGDDWRSGACALCFGEIGEQRQKLYEHGVALDVSLTQTPQGVVSGGKDKVWKYSGNADYYLALDSDRLGLWPGGLLKVTGRTKFGRGVIPTRPLDRYGIGFYALLQSDDFENQPIIGSLVEDEWGMEVFYNMAITPWLQFSPSVQYIDSGQVAVDHSVVVTTRLQIYF
jgi:carbohydrate-selective porin OprB